MRRLSVSAALFGLALALGLALVLPIPALAVPMPGSPTGPCPGCTFTLSEVPEPPGGGSEGAIAFNIVLPPGIFLNDGFLLMCEPNTTCDPTDQTHQNWSDTVQFANFNPFNNAILFSDPTFFLLSSPNTEIRPEVIFTGNEFLGAPPGGDGVVYTACDGANCIRWNIISDAISDQPAIPEPATFLLLGSGLAGLAAWRRRRK